PYIPHYPFGYLRGLPLLLFVSVPATAGGSIPAILLNIPGTELNVVTMLDGFPMTKKGKAGRALGAAFMASGLGGIGGVFLALALIPAIIVIVKSIGSPEQWALVLLGIVFIGSMGGSKARGLISGLLGILISLIGYEAATGIGRFTFGTAFLYDGLGLVPVLLGLFAVPELIDIVQRGSIVETTEIPKRIMGDIWEGMKDVFRHFGLFVRSNVIGFLIGVLPGIGGAASIFVAYGQAVKTSKHPEMFGTGIVEGVIAPEAANNAKEGGALLPTLGFGIPGSVGMTIILAGFIMVGLQPGPTMLTEHLDLCFNLLWSVAAVNIVAIIICLAFIRYAIKVAYISADYLAPVIAVFVCAGVFAYHEYLLDFVVLLTLAALGYCMKRFDYSRPALILGFILGTMFERNLFISLSAYGPEFIYRPIVLVILTMAVVIAVGDQIRAGATKLFKLVRGQ
ncbi:tripartite tricarboxylate transporter permease, partial [Chloroflexota bacterium]